jgi:hypothetical protein
MSLEPETIELMLQHMQQQVDELRQRAASSSKFGNRLVGGIIVVAAIVGGMQWFIVRQVVLLDAVRDSQRNVIERLIVLEVERKFERSPPVDEKAKDKPNDQ